MAKRSEKTVLFLCTGNYYRSRFAEILFNSVAGKMGLPWKASSKGLALKFGVNNIGPMSSCAVKALQTLGLCATEDWTRLPAEVAVDDLEQANLIIALKQAEHLPMLKDRFSAWVERVEFWHIEDAPGVLPQIEREVMGLTGRLSGGSKRQAP
jgi:protein-tyrosine-phosphatase